MLKFVLDLSSLLVMNHAFKVVIQWDLLLFFFKGAECVKKYNKHYLPPWSSAAATPTPIVFFTSWSSPAVVTGQWLAEQAFPLCQDGTRDWRKAGTHWASEQQQQKREASNAYLTFFTVWPFKKRKKERKKEKKDPAGQPLSLKSLGHLVVVRMCSMCLYSEDFNVKMRSYLIADAYTVTDQIEQRKYQCNP